MVFESFMAALLTGTTQYGYLELRTSIEGMIWFSQVNDALEPIVSIILP
jgi:hypothetical protein